jgi:hypothetical protein
MKKIILILFLAHTMIACGQSQTWTGKKTFASSLEFLNVPQDETNVKILSLNSSTNRPGWLDKASF